MICSNSTNRPRPIPARSFASIRRRHKRRRSAVSSQAVLAASARSTWGGLRDIGNIIRLRVVTMEAEPRVLDLTGWDLQKVRHAYGTNGIITEVEMPLAPAYDWVDVLVGYDDFMAAVRCSMRWPTCNGILIKEIAPIAAPDSPRILSPATSPIFAENQSIVVLMIAPHSMDAFAAFSAAQKGEIIFRSDKVESMKGIPARL